MLNSLTNAAAAVRQNALLSNATVGLALAACGFNALLAIVNAHVHAVPSATVIAIELLILGTGAVLIFANGAYSRDVPIVLFWTANLIIALMMSLANDMIYVDALRNVSIIAVFSAIGYRAPREAVHRAFLIISSIVLAVLLLEIFSLATYVSIFEPAAYYEASRGWAQRGFNETGLFANALGFNGRFSWGIYSGPRTSSIFLEQVSLAGYAAVLLVYMSGNWSNLPRNHKFLHAVLIIAILVTNNSRTSSALLFVLLLGYFIYPRLPAIATIAVPPALIAAAFLIGKPTLTMRLTSDDLKGRLSLTVTDLYNLNAEILINGWIEKSRHSFDSGYMYIIASSTVFGLMALWAYFCLFPKAGNDNQKRVRWGVNTYLWMWLLIGGTAIFTMKTSALLWLLVGNMGKDAASDAPASGQRGRILRDLRKLRPAALN